MGVITSKLTTDIPKFHDPGEAELAVIVIDEKHHWKGLETAENANFRRMAQQEVLRTAKSLNCRTITIDMSRRESPHIESIVGEPDFKYVKGISGVLGDKGSHKLVEYLNSHHVSSLLVMGGNVDACIYHSLVGFSRGYDLFHPGFLSYGYTVLTAPTLLSPYCPVKYIYQPKFHPDAVEYNEQDCDELHDRRFNKKDKTGEWPVYALLPGMRIYTEV